MERDSLLDHLSALFGKLLDALASIACVMVFAMVIVICLDVLLRNVALIPTMRFRTFMPSLRKARFSIG